MVFELVSEMEFRPLLSNKNVFMNLPLLYKHLIIKNLEKNIQ